MSLPIIIDCDPGLDDAIALMLALRSPELDIKAITTSAGNQTPEKTLHNALGLLTLFGHNDIPVAGGAQKPLMRSLIVADYIHGDTGVGNTQLPTPTCQPVEQGAIELIAQILRDAREPITLVVTGPMTNIALLLSVHPELKPRIKQIVFMGGAMRGGNTSPVSEFNIAVDPEAAEIVMQAGIPLVMAGLDVTHKAFVLSEEIEQFRAINNPVAQAVAGMLDYYLPAYLRNGLPGAALHDPCTIAWLLAPQLFDSIDRFVTVETRGQYTQGMTVVDENNRTGNPANVKVLTNIDRAGFLALLLKLAKRY